MRDPVLPDAGPGVDAQVDGGPVVRPDTGLPPPVIETCTAEGMGATLGDACDANADCDDGCYCNGTEMCEGGTCVAGANPCVDTVECTADVCLEEANRCFYEPQHELCGNGNACDGTELCDPRTGCVAGTPPYCNDENSCTVDSCSMESGCVFQARDLDGDGFTDGRCGGEDCDDDPRFGTMIYPGATEDCMNRRDDDCDGMRDYNDTDCRPTNDTCDSAVFLPGAGTYSGSTAGLASNFTLGCRSGGGPDAVFRFTLAAPQDVQVTVAGAGTSAGVSIRPFAMCATGPDDKCNAGTPPSFLRRSLPAGDYAIIVQSSGAGAAFDLNLRISPPTPIPAVDQCNASTQDLCGGMPCTSIVGATFPGMFGEVEDDYSLTCAFSGLRDAAYRFTITSPKDVSFSASTGSSTTYLALTTDCSRTTSERRCVASSWMSPAEFRQRELPPGTYYLLIESSDPTITTWTLTATITDPLPRNPGDACSVPINISEPTLGAGGSGMVSASTLDLDSGNICGGSTPSFRDANFVFTLPSTRDVTLTTTAAITGTYYTSLQSVCGDSSSNLRCWSGSGTVGQSWRSLPAGTYYVTLSSTATVGNHTASIVTAPPTPIPPNDRCAGAIPLTSGVSRRDSTIGFADDSAGGSCASGSRPDAFYSITLTARSTVIVSVSDADGGSTSFWLTLRSTTCGTGSQVACTSGSPSTINTTLDPGTYFLQVETNATDMSDYNIFPTIFPI